MRKLLFLLLVPICAILAQGSNASAARFVDKLEYPTGPCWATPDLNGDGIPDLFCYNPYLSNSIQPYIGNGDGTFRTGPVSSINFEWFDLVPADMNGDGKIDFVLAGLPPGKGDRCCVAVSLGNGDGTFQPLVSYVAGGDQFQGISISVGDFNGDGIPDVGTVGASGFWLFLGKGDGTLNTPVLSPLINGGNYQGSVVATDVNRDGKLDVIASSSAGFAVLLGNGEGTFQAPQPYSGFQGLNNSLSVGDLNGDGLPDVVLTSEAVNYVLVYFGMGNGKFTAPKAVSLPAVNGVAIADINGDGIPDLVSEYVYVAFGKGGGAFSQPVSYPVVPTSGAAGITREVSTADLRNNGRQDIITYGTVLLNQGHAKFQQGNWTPISGSGLLDYTVGDFNRDGKTDIAAATNTGVSILFSTGKAAGPFTPGPVTPLPYIWSIAAGDLNHDGILDLLIVTADGFQSTGEIRTYLGKGDGTFTQAFVQTLTSLGYPVLADFNGDGILDYAMTNNQMALGKGDGSFQTPTPIFRAPPYVQLTSMATADLNGDGKPDLVIAALFNSDLWILLNNGHGYFNVTQIDTSGICSEAGHPAIGDVNGDGSPDIVMGCDDNQIPIFLNDGKGTFALAKKLSGNSYLNGTEGAPLIADLNGDGIIDIAVLGQFGLVLYYGEGGLNFKSPLWALGVGLNPFVAQVGDFHGQPPQSGKPDIIVPDGSGAVLTIFNATK